MKHRLALALMVVVALGTSVRPADAKIWDWMQEWSGPGPFTHAHNFPLPMFTICQKDYRELSIRQQVAQKKETPFCLFVDIRRLVAQKDATRFPVRVSATFVDVGITNKAELWRFHDSLELGLGIGFMHASADRDGDVGGKSINRITATGPRVVAKPLLAFAELIKRSPKSNHNIWFRILSAPKAHLGATVVFAMSADRLGVYDEAYKFGGPLEYLVTRGIMVDIGELFPDTFSF
jgi:hypothetical protein